MIASSGSYSLDGVTHAPRRLHKRLSCCVRSRRGGEDDRLVAGYLVGGFAVGQGDAFSDDFQVIVADEAIDDVTSSWHMILERLAPPVHVNRIPNGVVLVRDLCLVRLCSPSRGGRTHASTPWATRSRSRSASAAS